MVSPGDLVTFSYPAVKLQGTQAHDKNPTVLVLHPNYEGIMHGLNFNYLGPQEINMIRMLLSPKFQLENKAALTRQRPDLIKRFDSIVESATESEVNSSAAFYSKVIKPLITTGGIHAKKYEPYRQYRVDKIKGLRIVTAATIMTADAAGGGSAGWNAPTSAWNAPKGKKSLWQKFLDKTRGTKGAKLPTRAPNFKKNRRK